jgi:hypothetical protein
MGESGMSIPTADVDAGAVLHFEVSAELPASLRPLHEGGDGDHTQLLLPHRFLCEDALTMASNTTRRWTYRDVARQTQHHHRKAQDKQLLPHPGSLCYVSLLSSLCITYTLIPSSPINNMHHRRLAQRRL